MECPELGPIIQMKKQLIARPEEHETAAIKARFNQLEKKSKNFDLQEDGLLTNRCTLASGVRGLQMYETVAGFQLPNENCYYNRFMDHPIWELIKPTGSYVNVTIGPTYKRTPNGSL
jgi:hypothetical protein